MTSQSRKPASRVPILSWASRYNSQTFLSDLIAAVIVAIMLIPQSLAYAQLAGLPAEVGLYASIFPLVAYAIFGSSTSLSVGPVAITSLMTAAALGEVANQGTASYLTAAITLAALSGLILLLFGFLRLGFLANFLSHSVVSAFISASAIIIALSQLRHLLGVEASGDDLFELLYSLFTTASDANTYTMAVGGGVLLLLLVLRSRFATLLQTLGVPSQRAHLLAKTAPVVGVILSIWVVASMGLESRGVAIVGEIPRGMPSFLIPDFSLELVRQLMLPAALISIIGYVESISVGRTLGAKRRERVDSNQELVGLGAANLASSFSGGFPVTGGFSRSVVNFDAGSVTQAASIFTAIFIALVSIFLTPYLYFLPKATLAVTIIVAVLSLVDFSVLANTWRYSKSEFSVVLLTLLVTLGFGVESGVSCGVLLSLGLHLYRTSIPHIADVGLVEGTEHFRNTRRYKVQTVPEILTLRLDESLFFANASFLEDCIHDKVFYNDRIAHVILMCNAINEIDYSALVILQEINKRLHEQGIVLHLSEVKGPVMDILQTTDFFAKLTGEIYLSQYQAFKAIQSKFDYAIVD